MASKESATERQEQVGRITEQVGEAYGARSNVDEYLRLFGNWDPTDYPAFHERIEACRPFLEEIGVRLRRTKRSAPGTTVEDKVEGDLDRTYWTGQVPAWKHKRGLMD